jgi:alkyl hydroperoxide reductase subunit AhpC
LSVLQRSSTSTLKQENSRNIVNIFLFTLLLDCQVVGCSTDSHFTHREFALKPRDQGGLAPLSIPLLADITHNIAKSYGVLVTNPEDAFNGLSLRGTFIIDDKGVLRHSQVNDASVGRNIDETLRLLKAFQFADKHGEVCPAKWEPGKATISPASSEKVNEYWKKEHAAKH